MSHTRPEQPRPEQPWAGPPEELLDRQRTETLDLLLRHIRDGDLTLDEYGIRVERVLLAQSNNDIHAALNGLPTLVDPAMLVLPLPADITASPLPRSDRITTRPRSLVSAFSDQKLEGRWKADDELAVRGMFGTTRIDLRQAVITCPELRITGFVAFGTLEVIVPPGTDLEVDHRVFFGSRKQDQDESDPLPGMPRVRLEASVAFGELRVRVRTVGERRIRLKRKNQAKGKMKANAR